MAQYIVPQGEFIKIAETSGTIQNDSLVTVEISTEPAPLSGVKLYPHESKAYEALPQYIRAIGGVGNAVVNVVGFIEVIEDGDDDGKDIDFATDEEVAEMIDDVFGGKTPDDVDDDF